MDNVKISLEPLIIVLIQEDECVPDAREYFIKQFKDITRLDFSEVTSGKNISPYDDEVVYQQDEFILSTSAHEPWWVLKMAVQDFGYVVNKIKQRNKLRRLSWNKDTYITLIPGRIYVDNDELNPQQTTSAYFEITSANNTQPWIISPESVLAHDWVIATGCFI